MAFKKYKPETFPVRISNVINDKSKKASIAGFFV
jgi:hypothetical protein